MRPEKIAILLVDDSVDDRTLTMRAFRKTRGGGTDTIRAVANGSEALAYLKGEGIFSDRAQFPFPSIILTDIKMDGGDGFNLLERLKKMPNLGAIPVSVLSASAASGDIQRAYALGASSYHVKPNAFTELENLLKVLMEYWRTCELPVDHHFGQNHP